MTESPYLWSVLIISIVIILIRTAIRIRRPVLSATDRARMQAALASIPPLEASKEEREAFNKTLSSEEKMVVVAAMLSATSKWDWRQERETIMAIRRLRPLSASEEKQRNALTSHERSMVLRCEVTAGGRVTPEQCHYVVDELRRKAAAKEDAKEQEELKERAAAEAFQREMRIASVASQLPVRFRLVKETRFHVRGGETRTLQPGDYDGSVSLAATDPEEDDDWQESNVVCRFRFRGSGGEWQSESRLRLTALMDLEEPEFSKHGILWSEARSVWKSAFVNRCIAAATHVSDDSRSRFSLKLGQREFTVMLKYSHWRADLVLAEDGRNVLVRIYELQAEKWINNPSAAKEEDKVKFDDFETVPPFCVQLPVEKLLPVTASSVHAPLDSDDDDEENERVEFDPV